jgi:acyl-coenzyme A synthetase/AMP-(fatty) acid ligase
VRGVILTAGSNPALSASNAVKMRLKAHFFCLFIEDAMFSALPTTAQLIQYHATVRPHGWAMHCANEDISYARLNSDLKRMTAQLADLTLECSKQSIVEVCIDDHYLNWLVLLGLENLGLCSSSVAAVEHIISVPDLWPVSLILCTDQAQASKSIRTVCLDRNLFKAVNPTRGHPFSPVQYELSDTLRMLKTSGTTGSPKRISLTRNMFEGWVARWSWFCNYGHKSVCWINAPFSVGGMYAAATACMRAGGAVVLNDAISFRDAWIRYGVTHATLLPIELTKILPSIGGVAISKPKMMLTIFGGAVPPSHFDQALTSIAHDVVDMYGTNEVGFIGIRRREGLEDGLVILPGVEIDICDEMGVSLGAGVEGYVRIKTAHMAQDYVDSQTLQGRLVLAR